MTASPLTSNQFGKRRIALLMFISYYFFFCYRSAMTIINAFKKRKPISRVAVSLLICLFICVPNYFWTYVQKNKNGLL